LHSGDPGDGAVRLLAAVLRVDGERLVVVAAATGCRELFDGGPKTGGVVLLGGGRLLPQFLEAQVGAKQLLQLCRRQQIEGVVEHREDRLVG
jgi:hypothetical protein